MSNDTNLNLENYLLEWNLSNPIKLHETNTCYVYLVSYLGNKVILKLLTEIGQMGEASGTIALQCYNGSGAVRLLKADNAAHLLSYVDGISLKEMVLRGHDEQANEIVCEVLQLLHSSPKLNGANLKTLAQNFRPLFNYSGNQQSDAIFVAAAECAHHLLATEKEKVILHGDIHHSNIIHSSTEGWLAIDPKGLYGERTYDFANVFFNPNDMPEFIYQPERIIRTAKQFSNYFKIDYDRILKFAFSFGCLSALWDIEDGVNPEDRLRVARIIQKLRDQKQ